MLATKAVPAATPTRAWLAVGLLFLMAVLSYLDRQIIALLVEPISRDLGIDDVQISLLQGIVFALFYCCFGLPIGIFVDRWSRRWLIWGGITIWSLAAIGCGLARNHGELLTARFFVGAGEAALSPAAFSMIADLFPRKRLALASSVFAIGTAVGNAAAFGAGGAIVEAVSGSHVVLPMIGELKPWQLVFIVTGAPGLLIGPLIFLMPEPGRSGRDGAVAMRWSPAPLLAFLRKEWRFFVGHAMGFGVLALILYGTTAWAPALLMRRFGWSVRDTGAAIGAVMLAGGLIGFVTNGALVDRWYAKGRSDAHLAFYTIGVFVYAGLIIAACLSGSPVIFLTLLGLAQTATCFSGVAAAAIQIVVPESLRGQVIVIYIFIMNMIGFGLGPTSVAMLTEHVFGRPEAVNLSILTVVAIGAPIAAGFFWLAMPRMRAHAAGAPDTTG